jgi:hypothetical protein
MRVEVFQEDGATWASCERGGVVKRHAAVSCQRVGLHGTNRSALRRPAINSRLYQIHSQIAHSRCVADDCEHAG